MRRSLAVGLHRMALAAVLILSANCASTAVPETPTDRSARIALETGLAKLGADRGDERLLLLTNAGYARPNGRGTESFADVATRVTGCSIGRRSLYFLHSPATADLWFALFRRDTRQAFFGRRQGDEFATQELVLNPELVSDRGAWGIANEGPVRGSLYGILSFSNAWAQGADPLLLKCAEFHNHCCGGVTAGYLTGRYIQREFPLRPGEEYVFVTASPSCAMDALQVMFDATTGKKGMFSTRASVDRLAEHGTEDARPLTLVLRVNERADTCDGLLLGFAWERTPQRTRLWDIAEVERQDCVRVLKRISGDAALATDLAATGTDPYGHFARTRNP